MTYTGYTVFYEVGGKQYSDTIDAEFVEWTPDNSDGVRFYNKIDDENGVGIDQDSETESTIAYYMPDRMIAWKKLPVAETAQQVGDVMKWLAEGKRVRHREWPE